MSARGRWLVVSVVTLVTLVALGAAPGALRPATRARGGARGGASGASPRMERSDGTTSTDRSTSVLGPASEIAAEPRGPSSPPGRLGASLDLELQSEGDGHQRALRLPRSPQAPPPAEQPGGPGTWSMALGTQADTSTFDAGASFAVTLYGADWCGYTRQARAWLHSVRVPVSEHDVDLDPDARARLHVLNPRGSIPTFEVRGHVLEGFSPSALGHLLELAARER